MKFCVGVEVQVHVFLTWALNVVERSASCSHLLNPVNGPTTHFYGIYVQLKVQLDVLFIYILYSSIFLAVHVSGVIALILRSTNCSLQP
jgi:hypothetical protein